MQGQLDDVVWGSGPKDEAVARVSESRLELGVLEPQQKRVDDELVILGREEFLLLLGISGGAMGGIECLDLGLQSCQQTTTLALPTHSIGLRLWNCLLNSTRHFNGTCKAEQGVKLPQHHLLVHGLTGLTGRLLQTLMRAWYGFSPGLMTRPERSSSLFFTSVDSSVRVMVTLRP